MDQNLYRQGYYSSSGTVLQRKISHRGDMYLEIFLREYGRLWVTAYGSAKGRVRFGGGTEPLTWGKYYLYRGIDRFSLKSVEVFDDMWSLRKNRGSLKKAAGMVRAVRRHLPPDQPDDKLLAILYWNTVLLTKGCSPDAVEWRFLWKWLDHWGLAPSMHSCSECGGKIQSALWSEKGILCLRCSAGEQGAKLEKEYLMTLLKAARLSSDDFIELFSQDQSENDWYFTAASGRALEILNSRG